MHRYGELHMGDLAWVTAVVAAMLGSALLCAATMGGFVLMLMDVSSRLSEGESD
jgi:hypothetical protein